MKRGGRLNRDPEALREWKRTSRPLKRTKFKRKPSKLARSPLSPVGRRKLREKKQKLVDGPLCDRVRKLPCCVCEKPPPSHPHHVSGGTLRRDYLPDGSANVAPLCFTHHVGSAGVHTLGPETFAARFGVCLAAIAQEIGTTINEEA